MQTICQGFDKGNIIPQYDKSNKLTKQFELFQMIFLQFFSIVSIVLIYRIVNNKNQYTCQYSSPNNVKH